MPRDIYHLGTTLSGTMQPETLHERMNTGHCTQRTRDVVNAHSAFENLRRASLLMYMHIWMKKTMLISYLITDHFVNDECVEIPGNGVNTMCSLREARIII